MNKMKTMPLNSEALQIAKDLTKLFLKQREELNKLDQQIGEIKKLAYEQMSKGMDAIKKAMNLPPETHMHIDSTYLEEHGIVFAQIFTEPPMSSAADLMQHLFGVREDDDTPPTLQ